MVSPTIRTITFGIAEPHPVSAAALRAAETALGAISARYRSAGYAVQTLRLSMRPLFEDFSHVSRTTMTEYARDVHHQLDAMGITFCSLGAVPATERDFPLERLEWIVDLIASYAAFNMTVQLAHVEHGLCAEALLPTARVMQRLALETDEGFGNFRFAALACVEPGSPFFPAAYHRGPASFALGLQGVACIAEAVALYTASGIQDLEYLTQCVQNVLIRQATPLVELGQVLAREYGLHFGGIDLSPAPMGDESIAAAIEACGMGRFGAPGTLAICAALTAGLKATGLPTCGYNGLMLPVLEDAVLGRRWEEGQLHIHQLLAYSAICGTGLDTIPLPGDTAVEQIAHLLLDVSSLALRLHKPLSARLFPVPGMRAGERTVFTSPYLTNTLLYAL